MYGPWTQEISSNVKRTTGTSSMMVPTMMTSGMDHSTMMVGTKMIIKIIQRTTRLRGKTI